jgi:WD40 repeat protein
LRALKAHAQNLRNLAFSPDDQTLATVADDRFLKLWDVATRTLRAETVIPGQLAVPGFNVPLVWSPDGRTLALANSMEIMIYDGVSGRLLKTLNPGELVYSMRFSAAGDVLVSAAADYQLTFWNPRSGMLVNQIPTSHQVGVYDMSFSPDGRTLATVVDRVKLWSLTTRQEVSTLEGHQQNIFSAMFSPTGDLLVTADYEGSIRLWAARSFREIDGGRDH